MGPFCCRYDSSICLKNMALNADEIRELIFCVRFYQQMHISLQSPRYEEFQELLEKLESLHDQD